MRIEKYVRYIGIGIWFFLGLFSLSAEDLSSLKKEGIQAFFQKDYVKAISLLEKYTAKAAEDEEAIYYLSEAYGRHLSALTWIDRAKKLIEQNRYTQAKRALEKAKEISPLEKEIPVLEKKLRSLLEERDLLENLPPKRKEYVRSLIQEAKKSYENGEFESALELYSKVLSVVPNYPPAKEGYAEALKAYKEKIYQERLVNLFSRAERLQESRLYVQAKEVYEEILSIDPTNLKALKEKKRLEELIRKEREELEKRKHAEEFLKSGKAYLKVNRFEEAIEQFYLGKGIYPEYAPWDKWIEITKKKREEYIQKEFERKLRELDQNFQRGLLAFAQEKFQEAISYFEKVVEIAYRYNQKEILEQALEFIENAKEQLKLKEEEEIPPESPYYELVESLKAMGIAEYKKGNYSLAMEYFQAILELFPKNRIANKYVLLITIQRNPARKKVLIQNFIQSIQATYKKSPFRARRLFQILEEIVPDDPQVRKLRPLITGKKALVKKGVSSKELQKRYKKALELSNQDPKKAIAILKKVLQEDPTFQKARILLARIEARLSEKYWRRELPKINPKAHSLYAKGIFFYNQGNIEEAILYFEEALKIEPNFLKARVALEKCRRYLHRI